MMRPPALALALIVTALVWQGAVAQHLPFSAEKTPLGTLLANPAAYAVIARQFPDLVASKSVQAGFANRMTLRSLKRFRPKEFTDARLAAVDAELSRLPAQ